MNDVQKAVDRDNRGMIYVSELRQGRLVSVNNSRLSQTESLPSRTVRVHRIARGHYVSRSLPHVMEFVAGRMGIERLRSCRRIGGRWHITF